MKLDFIKKKYINTEFLKFRCKFLIGMQAAFGGKKQAQLHENMKSPNELCI